MTQKSCEEIVEAILKDCVESGYGVPAGLEMFRAEFQKALLQERAKQEELRGLLGRFKEAFEKVSLSRVSDFNLRREALALGEGE